MLTPKYSMILLAVLFVIFISTDTGFSTVINIYWDNGNTQTITLGGNAEFSFFNGKSGATYKLIIKQDGSGNRTATWSSDIKWFDGTPVLSTAINAIDVVTFIYNGTDYLGNFYKGFHSDSTTYGGSGWVDDGTAVRLSTTTDKVGIGLTSPGAKLSLKTIDTTTVPLQVESLIRSSLVGWGYRKPITITNSGGALTDYQVLIILDTSTPISQFKMRTDCGDIRFIDSDALTLLSYWFESGTNSSTTRIWVKVPSIPASTTKTIYVYYGNSVATSLSNGDSTFIFFDHFDSYNSAKWFMKGTITYSGSKISLSSPSATYPYWLVSQNSFDVRGKAIEIMTGGGRTFPCYSDSKLTGGTEPAFVNGYPIIRRYDNQYLVGKMSSSDWFQLYIDATYFSGIPYAQMVYSKMTVEPSSPYNTKWYARKDGIYDLKYNENWSHSSYNMYLYPIWLSTGGAGYTMEVDWIFIRNYNSTEPTTSVGSEEIPPPQQQTVFYIQNASGNVGIGTTTPGQKLDIAYGNGRVQSGYNWLTNSDIRYKKNITQLDDVLNKLFFIHGVRYDLKEDNNIIDGKGKYIGFIAQELENEFPELVITGEDGFKSIAYDKITTVLLEAIKEQQKQIENQQNEINELKAKINKR